MMRLLVIVTAALLSAVAPSAISNAREVRVALVLLPHVMLYDKCKRDAAAKGDTDPVNSCAPLRKSLLEQARVTLNEAGYSDNMLQEMRRFESELNISDRNSKAMIDKATREQNAAN